MLNLIGTKKHKHKDEKKIALMDAARVFRSHPSLLITHNFADGQS